MLQGELTLAPAVVNLQPALAEHSLVFRAEESRVRPDIRRGRLAELTSALVVVHVALKHELAQGLARRRGVGAEIAARVGTLAPVEHSERRVQRVGLGLALGAGREVSGNNVEAGDTGVNLADDRGRGVARALPRPCQWPCAAV